MALLGEDIVFCNLFYTQAAYNYCKSVKEGRAVGAPLLTWLSAFLAEEGLGVVNT